MQTAMHAKVDRFVEQLQSFPKLPNVFNPYADYDEENDISTKAREYRSEHLRRYLTERMGKAKLILCAEAPGYQGCHFSGIAMTSERILLNHLVKKGVRSDHVISQGAQRTSKDHGKFKGLGANEPTATIVWGKLMSAGLDSREFVLWNAFCFHPMADGYLTNRKPTPAELDKGQHLLEAFIDLFPEAKRVAIGRVSEALLAERGISTVGQVRHPANGGATLFRDGIQEILLKEPK
jgi:hypothetical protein